MKTPSFISLLDPVQESEINLNLRRSADNRTIRAIKRQAKLMGMSPRAYLRQAIATVIAGNEEATVITGRRMTWLA